MSTSEHPPIGRAAVAARGRNAVSRRQATLAGTPGAGAVGPLLTTVLIAGDDSEAKSQLGGVITAGRSNVIAAGSLKPAGSWRRWASCRSALLPTSRFPGPAGSAS